MNPNVNARTRPSLARRGAQTSIALALLALVAACSTAAPAATTAEGELDVVRFSEVIHSVFYAPQYVAMSEGFFEEEGIEVVSQTADGSDRGTAALLAGAADIALVGPETAIYLHNNPEGQTKVRVFAALANIDGSLLMGHDDPSTFTWEDVRGRTIIGWRPGSMPQMVLEWVLDQHGLVPGDDVEVVTNLEIAAAAGAFTQGQGDYITVFEPTAANLANETGAQVLASMGEEVGPIPYTVYTATEAFIEEHPDLVERWTNAIHRAQAWAREATPRELAESLAPHFDGADIDELEEAMARYQQLDPWPADPTPSTEGLDRLQDVMVHGGVLEDADRVGYDDVIEPTFAQRVAGG